MLGGRTKTNVKDVAKKRARKSTDSITAQVGMKSDDGSQRPSESVSKKRAAASRRKWAQKHMVRC